MGERPRDLLVGHRTGSRRGFVLGLTLAETLLLLLFVVLLLLVIGFAERERQIGELTPAAEVVSAIAVDQGLTVAAILSDLRMLDRFKSLVVSSGHVWDESFLELVRAAIQSGTLDNIEQLLRQLEQKSIALTELVSQAEGIESVEELVARLETMAVLESTVRNQRGQLAEMQSRLSRAGQGLVLPSCWSTAEGQIEYFADIALESAGIRARETTPTYRQEERLRMPMAPLEEGFVYSPSEFLTLTQRLYNFSVEQECRFYVMVYDNTESDQKERYIELMLTVEGHFYKRQMRGKSPF